MTRSDRPTARRQPLALLGAAIGLGAALLAGGGPSIADAETAQLGADAPVRLARPASPALVRVRPRCGGLSSVTLWLAPAAGLAVPDGVDVRVRPAGIDVAGHGRVAVPSNAAEFERDIPLPTQATAGGAVEVDFAPFAHPPRTSYDVEVRVSGAPDAGLALLGRPAGWSVVGTDDGAADVAAAERGPVGDDGASAGGMDDDDGADDGAVAVEVACRFGMKDAVHAAAALAGRGRTPLALLAVLVLPGLAVARVLRFRAPGGDIGHAAAVVALSLAYWALGLSWVTAAGASVGGAALAAAAAAPLVALAGAAASAGIAARDAAHAPPGVATAHVHRSFSPWATLRPVARPVLVVAAGLVPRLAQASALAAPPWVDGANHGLIVARILAAGREPAALLPFADLPGGYHAGFHAGAAAFSALSGHDVPSALLIYGVVLGAVAALAAAAFAGTLDARPRAMLAAAVVVALLAPLPAGLMRWSRLTQLAGLVVLAPLAALLAAVLAGRRRRGDAIVIGVLAAGVALIHFRVAAFAAVWAVAWIAPHALPAGALRRRRGSPVTRHALAVVALGALVAAVLAAPGLVPRMTTFFAPKLRTWTGTTERAFDGWEWGYVLDDGGAALWAIGLVGLALLARRRPRAAAATALWPALLLVLANPRPLGLPGQGFVSHSSVAMALWLPQAALVGTAVSRAVATARLTLRRRDRRGGRPSAARGVPALGAPALRAPAFGLAVGVVLAWGGVAMTAAPVSDTVLLLARDRAVIDAVARFVPPGETVLTNAVPWGRYQVAGTDGGAWLSVLADRPTLPPPQLYALADVPIIERINAEADAVRMAAGDPGALADVAAAHGRRWLFVGARGGPVAAGRLAASGRWRVVAEGDGSALFERVDPIGPVPGGRWATGRTMADARVPFDRADRRSTAPAFDDRLSPAAKGTTVDR